MREKILLSLLETHYRSKIKRQWMYTSEAPHFFEHRVGIFEFGFTQSNRGVTHYSRGFYTAEMIRDKDVILDIGCGDGFFSRRFFCYKSSHIDAIDIDQAAISVAKKYNASPKINYLCHDVLSYDFPRNDYDLVVWDGAIGHFSSATMSKTLNKIKRAMKPNGVFTGSESLGYADYDHLQQFNSLEDFHILFKEHFRFVQLKSIHYRSGIFDLEGDRTEGFWRCSDSLERLNESSWITF